jgi:hypothetical protein
MVSSSRLGSSLESIGTRVSVQSGREQRRREQTIEIGKMEVEVIFIYVHRMRREAGTGS